MINIEKALRSSTKYRYSIPQLLRLSSSTSSTFDLSKFSYEAARAGVVPQLGVCVMPLSKSSIARPYSCSGRSTSTGDDIVMQNGGSIPHAIRSPILPPPGLRAQEDQGFARFLKKHSSPTHQRVTAGGRIVPMETRASPPVFDLKDQATGVAQGFRTLFKAKMEDGRLISDPIMGRPSDMQQEPARNQAPRDLLAAGGMPMAAGTVTQPRQSTLGLHQSSTFARTFEDDTAQVHAYDMDKIFRALSAGELSYSQVNDVMSPLPHMPDHAHIPQNIHSAAHGIRGDYLGHDIIDRQVKAAKQSLAYWSQCYGELDQQLKTLDRQRAMTSLNADMVYQRRAIVQQRSDTKDIIKKIITFLSLSEHAFADNMHGKLNVNAPVYVPQQQQPPHDSVTREMNQSQVGANTLIKDCIQPPGARRPIPIVAPPSSITNSDEDDRHAQELESSDEVDEWGVKIGMAPPELQRRQIETMNSMSRPDVAEGSFGCQDNRLKGSLPFRSFSENDTYQFASESSSSEQEFTYQSQHGRAPPAVEQDYAKQLDALRRPKGTVTVVRLHDASSMTVEGQSLRRPATQTLTDFERMYWSRAGTVEEANPSPGSSEGTYAAQRIITPASLSCSPVQSLHGFVSHEAKLPTPNVRMTLNDSSGRISFGRRPELRPIATPQPLPMGSIHQPADSVSWRHHNYQDESGNDKDPFVFDTTHDSPRGPPPSSAGDVWMEEMYNKGYSSVSVQNVHATTAHFPYLDGTSEHSKRVEALLGHVAKAKSPRLLQRTGTGTGSGAWYGPFRRGVGGGVGEHDPTAQP